MTGAQRARRLGRYFIVFDNLLVVSGFYLVFPLISLHFVDQLGWLASAVGLALGIRQISQQGMGLLGGSLADRFGAKPLIVGGMLLRAAGFAAMAAASSPLLLLVSCVLSGLGGALFDPSRAALVVKLTRPHQRSRFYALLMMQESAAGMLGALLGAYLLSFEFRWVALGGCAVFLAAAAANALLLPAYRVAARRAPALAAARTVLSDKPFLLFVLPLSGYYAMVAQLMLLMPVTLERLAGTPKAVGWMFSLDALLAICLLYPLARLGERYCSLETRLLTGIGVMTAGLAAMSTVSSTGAAFAMLALFYTGTLIAEPARETLLARYARPEARASYMGMGKMGLALGGLAGYTGGGFLIDHARALNAPTLPWLALAAIGCITLAALYRILLPGRAPLAQPAQPA